MFPCIFFFRVQVAVSGSLLSVLVISRSVEISFGVNLSQVLILTVHLVKPLVCLVPLNFDAGCFAVPVFYFKSLRGAMEILLTHDNELQRLSRPRLLFQSLNFKKFLHRQITKDKGGQNSSYTKISVV